MQNNITIHITGKLCSSGLLCSK